MITLAGVIEITPEVLQDLTKSYLALINEQVINVTSPVMSILNQWFYINKEPLDELFVTLDVELDSHVDEINLVYEDQELSYPRTEVVDLDGFYFLVLPDGRIGVVITPEITIQEIEAAASKGSWITRWWDKSLVKGYDGLYYPQGWKLRVVEFNHLNGGAIYAEPTTTETRKLFRTGQITRIMDIAKCDPVLASRYYSHAKSKKYGFEQSVIKLCFKFLELDYTGWCSIEDIGQRQSIAKEIAGRMNGYLSLRGDIC